MTEAKKYIYEFRITQADGTSVHWSGMQTVTQIKQVIEGELVKLE